MSRTNPYTVPCVHCNGQGGREGFEDGFGRIWQSCRYCLTRRTRLANGLFRNNRVRYR